MPHRHCVVCACNESWKLVIGEKKLFFTWTSHRCVTYEPGWNHGRSLQKTMKINVERDYMQLNRDLCFNYVIWTWCVRRIRKIKVIHQWLVHEKSVCLPDVGRGKAQVFRCGGCREKPHSFSTGCGFTFTEYVNLRKKFALILKLFHFLERWLKKTDKGNFCIFP